MLGYQLRDPSVLVFVFSTSSQFGHSSFFKVSEDRFDEIHCNLIGFFKLSVCSLNLAPYLALRIMG